jgi:hypothetical protein
MKYQHIMEQALKPLSAHLPICVQEYPKSVSIVEQTGEQALDISKCTSLTEEGFARLVGSGQALEVAILTGARRLADGAVRCLAWTCPRLRLIDICGCFQVTTGAVLELVAQASQLSVLRASKIGNLSGKQVLEACANTELLELDLGFLQDIDDESVAIAVAGRLAGSIRKLSISRADLTDASLAAMFACTRLEHLDVSCAGELTSDEVLRLAGQHRSLTVLKVDGCRGVPNETRQSLVHILSSKCPSDEREHAPLSPSRNQLVQQLVELGVPPERAVESIVRHGTLHRALSALNIGT